MTNNYRHQMRQKDHYLAIEEYAPIGDLHTVALVGQNGSIDWCCLPGFDSPSVFAALLDTRKGGFFRISPHESSDMKYQQLYLPETNILLTRFLCSEGVGEITDFMPIKEVGTEVHQHQLVRSVSVVHGELEFQLTCRPAFHYAEDEHEVEIEKQGAVFKSQGFHLVLSSPHSLRCDEQGGATVTFTVRAGQSVHFLLQSTQDANAVPSEFSDRNYQHLFQSTLDYWRKWLSQCRYQGRWREMVQRSALVLKLLTYRPTGAIVAAPTTSLPEALGGERNWDYRYTWLRDASFSLYSLLSLGFTHEAEAFMTWLDKRCHELTDGKTLQPMYGINGEHELTERVLTQFEGYAHSKPVRVGNAAYTQQQLDIYGEFMDAAYIYNNHDAISYDLWQNIDHLLSWLADHWQESDEGIWEVRGGPKPFVHSRVMCWVAFDRALRFVHDRGWPAPIDEWTHLRTQIYQQIMEKGWNEKRQSFTQYYGSDAIDASTLLMTIVGFCGPREPRVLATINSIQQDLTQGAFVRRYNPGDSASDGFRSHEGAFGACSFWLVGNLARAGRLNEARLMLGKLFSYSSQTGLYAEEISPTGSALGNYPQAFTHLALILACITLDEELNKRQIHV